jgi:hypothetical protein
MQGVTAATALSANDLVRAFSGTYMRGKPSSRGSAFAAFGPDFRRWHHKSGAPIPMALRIPATQIFGNTRYEKESQGYGD